MPKRGRLALYKALLSIALPDPQQFLLTVVFVAVALTLNLESHLQHHLKLRDLALDDAAAHIHDLKRVHVADRFGGFRGGGLDCLGETHW